MATNAGPQITRSGLVAYYDPGSLRSFRGLTGTNITTGVTHTFNDGASTAFTKAKIGTESAFIPYFNDSVTVRFVDFYNDYAASQAQYGGAYCCPNLFSYGTGIAVSPSTLYTYQVIFKTETGYYHPNYMYRYEYSSGGATLTEAGLVDASRLEDLGDGWYHAWGQFTTTATTATINTYMFHYEYATWNRVRVLTASITAGSTVHRPEHLIAQGGSRGTTPATGGGLVDLVGGYSSDLVNGVSFNSANGGSLVFDGVDDYVNGPLVPPNAGNFSVRIVARWTSLSDVFAAGTGTGLGGGTYIQCYINTSGLIINLYTTSWNYGTTVPNVANTFANNTIYDITVVNTGNVWTFYKDGQFLATYTHSISTPSDSTRFGIFRNHVQLVGNAGNVHLFQVYNRAITAAEVLTNYNAFKIRLVRSTNRNTALIRPSLTTQADGLYNSVSLFLDPANRGSYTAGSQKWYDLSSNRRVVTFYNAGGTTYNASAPGPPTLSTEGRGSFVFDGVNDFGRINTGYSGYTLPSVNTVSIWVRTTSSGYQGVLSHCNGGPVGLAYGTTGGKMLYYYYTSSWQTLSSNASVNDGTWKNLVWVKSSTTSVKLYINGVLDTDGTLTGAISGAAIASVGSGWGPCNSEGYGAGTDSYGQVFNGAMGPLITWDRALSAGEVTQLYDAFRPRYSNQVVVTSGLALHLSAFDRASYTGSGTTWTDLSGINSAVTLTNGPAYASDSGGNLSFDGVDDYADFTVSGLGTTTTVEMWVKLGAGYTAKMFFGWLYYDVYCESGHIGYNTANSDVYGISSTTVTSLGLVGAWKHYVFEMRSDVSYTNNKIYVNGVSQTLSQQLSTEAAGSRSFNSGQGRIAGWRASPDYRMPMNLGLFRVYSRALTEAEIAQNFNAERWRFGV